MATSTGARIAQRGLEVQPTGHFTLAVDIQQQQLFLQIKVVNIESMFMRAPADYRQPPMKLKS
jgi:hypothetical protein